VAVTSPGALRSPARLPVFASLAAASQIDVARAFTLTLVCAHRIRIRRTVRITNRLLRSPTNNRQRPGSTSIMSPIGTSGLICRFGQTRDQVANLATGPPGHNLNINRKIDAEAYKLAAGERKASAKGMMPTRRTKFGPRKPRRRRRPIADREPHGAARAATLKFS
jgi:hypothetical protein